MSGARKLDCCPLQSFVDSESTDLSTGRKLYAHGRVSLVNINSNRKCPRQGVKPKVSVKQRW